MTKFSDLKLDPKVLQAVAEAGYENPTPIQAGAIPPALEGRDVLGIAQTGTGKTASFTLPMITLLGRGRARARMPRSLVLCPTRELAAQVAENFDTYAKHTRLTKALLIGGVSFNEQDKLIDRGVDVLIATPGRLLDHFERGKLLLTGVQIMVVDEADRMLDMGFIPDIERIFQLTPFTRQTLFFSATMAPEIERITDTFLHTPERIEVARQATASETITQKLVEITPTRKDQTSKQKRELLRALIDAEGEGLTNAIIFCNRKTDVDIVAKSLAKHGYDAAPIHGDLDQSHRTRTLDSFRDGRLKLLVASDVAARGLDIPAVSHVFNFDLPSHAEDYVHRIGRTGRAGRLGTAISVGTPSDEKYLSAIESLLKQTLPRAPAPEGFALSEGATSAPREGRDDRKGGRDRDRRRRGEHDRDRGREASRSEQPQPEPRREEAAREERHEQPRQESRREDRREDRRDNRRDERRDDRRDRDRNGRGRGEDRGHPVTGMGDHVPEFMLVPLRGAIEATANDDIREIEAEAAPTAPVAEAKPAPQPKPRRERRKPAEPAPQEAAAPAEPAEATAAVPAAAVESEAVEPAAAVEQQPAATPAAAATGEAATEAPAPRRTRRKKVADEETTAEAPAAKPRRTTRKKVAEDAPAESAPDAAEAPAKPKRSRKKAEPAAASADEASAEPAETAEAAAPKPRRTRRKKAEEAPATDNADADA